MAPDEFRALRIAAGLETQDAVAQAFDLDRRTVSRWANNGALPKVAEVALRCMARLRQLGFPAANGAAD